MKQYFLYFICLFLFSFRAFAADIPKDSADNDSKSMNSIIVGTDYSTNTNTFGRFDDVSTQPSFSPSVNFFSKFGFNLGVIGYFVANSDSTGTKTTNELDLQAGYTWKLGSIISICPSYTHFIFSKNSTTFKRSYNDYVQMNVIGNIKWWNGSISGKYLWGEFDELMLTGQTSVTIKFDHVLGKDHSLVLQPSAEIDLSNINYYRYIAGNYKFLRNYAALKPDATFNDLIYDLQNSPLLWVRRLYKRIEAYPYLQRRLNRISANGNFVISDLFSDKKEMKLSSLTLTLPVSYYIGDFIINLNFSAIKPYNQPKIFGNDWVTYFGAGISYTFDW